MKPLVIAGIFLPFFLHAQPLVLQDSILFFENNIRLENPFAGGMDQPQLSLAKINNDLLSDLFVFDRAGDRISVFVNQGSPGNPLYKYAPHLAASFPALRDWALLRDYNCDGKPDIFTALSDSSAVRVYKNTSQSGTVSFSEEYPKLTLAGGVLTVFETDLPAITDVDGDGDIDILNFDNQGSHVRFFENTGGCDSLVFVANTDCWGAFQEAGLSNEITLGTACKRSGGSSNLHSGSTLCTIDMEGDSVKELLLGDLNNPNIVYLHNAGTKTDALMDQVSMAFPLSHPANLLQFPAAFSLDADDDGKEDLLVAPNAPNISINRENLWFYRNTGIPPAANYTFEQNDFLSETMVDAGSVSYPVFFDYNSDGLYDLVIGNYLSRHPSAAESSGLTLY
ncbi:MAG: VCBS repeat-containing protein, partial [Bacteroidia bacterium]